MTLRSLTVLLLLGSGLASAEEPPTDTPDQAEIEKAVEDRPPVPAPTPTPAPAPAPVPAPAAAAPPAAANTWSRVLQVLNPEIAGIIDVAGGWYSRETQTTRSADDPARSGFNVQDIELAFQAVVDGYFRADVFVAVPNLQGLEVEEAYATSVRLPGRFQVKAGIFRAGFGRQNTQHLHRQDFVRRPQMNPLFLGLDGLRAPGLEVNWLVPRIPWAMLFAVSAFSVGKTAPDQVLQTFGGGERHDFTYLASVRNTFRPGRSTSLEFGFQYARGKSSQTATRNEMLPSTALTLTTVGPTRYDNFYTHLYGLDLSLRWTSQKASRPWAGLVWQSELFLRHIPNWRDPLGARAQVEGGLYTQLVGQVARQWLLGVRAEFLGLPEGDNVKRAYTLSGQIAWRFSDYTQLRAHGEIAFQTAPGTPRTSGAFFLQLQAAIGAHGAHPETGR